MNTPETRRKSPFKNPLVYFAGALSVGSLVWTTYSLMDWLDAQEVGLSAAAGADIVWGSVILAQAMDVRVVVKGKNILPLIGWALVVLVAGFLFAHGMYIDNVGQAVIGLFFPIGTKVVWVVALASLKDPTAFTDEQKMELADIERGVLFSEERHKADMRELDMIGEKALKELDNDATFEIRRANHERRLHRSRPLTLPGEVVRRQLEAGELQPEAAELHSDADTDAEVKQVEAGVTPGYMKFGFSAEAPVKPPQVKPASTDKPDTASVKPGGVSLDAQLKQAASPSDAVKLALKHSASPAEAVEAVLKHTGFEPKSVKQAARRHSARGSR